VRLDTFHSAVRPTVTYALAAALIAGFFVGKIPADVFYTIAGNAIAYWFGARGGNSGRRRSE
jgi:hypothetical protein